MVEFWFAVILFVLLGLYYWSKRSVWTTNRLLIDNLIMQEFRLNKDSYLVKILHECGADTFELKDVNKLSWRERRKYFNDIEDLFDSIGSHFKSKCAQLLIEHRYKGVDNILKTKEICKNSECKTCKLKKMKKELMH